MKYKGLIYKRRKISLFGIALFLMIFTINITFKLIKYIIINLISLSKWIYRYIQFVKSGYSYAEVRNIVLAMNGREFEKFCYELLKASGHTCKLTPQTNDYGRDIILYQDNEEIFIECKHYTGENSVVGREICQKLLGSVQMFNADKGIIITTGKIHENALECVDMVDNLEIWDMDDLMSLIIKVDQRELPKILVKSLGCSTKIVRLNPVRN